MILRRDSAHEPVQFRQSHNQSERSTRVRAPHFVTCSAIQSSTSQNWNVCVSARSLGCPFMITYSVSCSRWDDTVIWIAADLRAGTAVRAFCYAWQGPSIFEGIGYGQPQTRSWPCITLFSERRLCVYLRRLIVPSVQQHGHISWKPNLFERALAKGEMPRRCAMRVRMNVFRIRS